MSVPVRRAEHRNLPYFIALGSNLGDREATLRQAWAMLAALGCIGEALPPVRDPAHVRRGPAPVPECGRPGCHANLGPIDMLDRLHHIEKDLGRDRTKEIRMGPRTLDLDILLCGDLVMDSPALTIPHPRITERMFVLVPLLALSPWLRDPRTGTPVCRIARPSAGRQRAPDAGVFTFIRRPV